MSGLGLKSTFDVLSGTQLVIGLLWLGIAAFSVTLVLLMHTRWGQARPVRKCVVLSLLGHILLAGYATTVQIMGSAPGTEEEVVWISFVEGRLETVADGQDPAGEERPQEESLHDEVPQPEPSPIAELVRRLSPDREAEEIEALGRRAMADGKRILPVRTSDDGVPTALLDRPIPLPQLDSPATTPEVASSLSGPTDRLSRPAWAEAEKSYARNAGDQGHRADWQLPNVYRLRVAPDRLRLAQRRGATGQSEAAVRAALAWLAENQGPGGRWDAGDHGAGRELRVAGRDRKRAGIQADTGMTGLALLSFLASGHTHRRGPYRDNVRRGLEYLLRAQGRDGNLAGRATPFARMYCHAMATFAVSEAYGMTNDRRLKQPVLRAIGYTLSIQDSSGGGFRYKRGDTGDTSQIGWQLMALKSAELAGIPMPAKTRNGIIRYLQSVCSGSHGGLASYRPTQRITRPMTAEALVCWQFLGLPRDHPAGNEAGDYLLGELPGEGRVNLYYWYYATLGMYQLQGIHWQRWNDALRRELVARQRKTGPMAGSWDPDTVWGGYGGRVYSTALATLSLEVYYRYLPLYLEAFVGGDSSRR